jgi:hypothetical protein
MEMQAEESTWGFWVCGDGLDKIVQASYAKALWIGVAPIANETVFTICKGVVAVLLDSGPPCFDAEVFVRGLVPVTLRQMDALGRSASSLLCTSVQIAIHKVHPELYVSGMEVVKQRSIVNFAYALRPETFDLSEVQAILDCEGLRRELLLYWNVPVYDEV